MFVGVVGRAGRWERRMGLCWGVRSPMGFISGWGVHVRVGGRYLELGGWL